MDNIFQSIQNIQNLLDEAGIPSIVIGGFAVAAWGEPRVTRDVDLKILLGREDTTRLLEVISANYVPLTSQPEDILKRQGLVFVQDTLGTRIDILLAETSYDVIAIERGQQIELQPEVSANLCSAEDLVIYKMISTRARDHEDVKGVVRRQGDKLDDDYVLHWLRQFEIALDDSTLIAAYQKLRQEPQQE